MAVVGFVIRPDWPKAEELVSRTSSWAESQGHQVALLGPEKITGIGPLSTSDLGTLDLMVAVGGDGTMLRASRALAQHDVPVLGINMGRLGFLAPFDPSNTETAIAEALQGKLEISQRMRLSVALTLASGEVLSANALNDMVIHQADKARLVELAAFVDGDHITDYRADGVIVSTPTGSTAYNLAAGGPILTPGQRAMVLTPICAHTLTNRPVVVHASSTIEFAVQDSSNPAAITVDGDWSYSFSPGDKVRVTTDAPTFSLYQGSASFFEAMREKLHWGASSV